MKNEATTATATKNLRFSYNGDRERGRATATLADGVTMTRQDGWNRTNGNHHVYECPCGWNLQTWSNVSGLGRATDHAAKNHAAKESK